MRTAIADVSPLTPPRALSSKTATSAWHARCSPFAVMALRLFPAVFAVFACAACGGEISSSSLAQDASADVAVLEDAASADAPDASPIGVAHCPWETAHPPVSTVTYDKRCTTAADCRIGMHLWDCCGAQIALGVSAGDLSRFTRDGGLCGDEFGGLCDCASGGPHAEDGRTPRQPNGADIVVQCIGGACMTSVAP